MIINTYKDCNAIADTLKSTILGSSEINELQQYSEANFGKKVDIYNQVAINKNSYSVPYVAISTIGQQETRKGQMGIDIDFAIPGTAKEIVQNGVTTYEGREKLEEFADIILKLASKACVSHPDLDVIFQPREISKQKKEYSGNIQFSYTSPRIISRR